MTQIPKTKLQKEKRYFRLLWGSQIRALRLYRGWSQGRLARTAKTSQAHIARIENGQANITMRTIETLITVLRGRLQLEIAPQSTTKEAPHAR